ncbi:acyltransferase family protein [Pseudalkalibacillus sp. Hm43]|uniref:acyltransferase family protein n=1 Tax=Pseudalkalibacillus sp. Hm43 TaxID=3450742 RepID=UPI003F43F468
MKEIKLSRRIDALDIARGILVILALFVSNIPPGGYESLRHAPWYGLTISDVLFPGFLTLFGAGLAVAYRNSIRWKKVFKRTFWFWVIGLAYNAVVTWNNDLSTLRITGVLQLFAISGLIAVILTIVSRTWLYVTSTALVILIGYSILLSFGGQSCTDQLVQPDCNPLHKIDAMIYGNEHTYHNGTKGYDPEGTLSMISAVANILLGYGASRIILAAKRYKVRLLTVYALGLIAITPVFSLFVPIAKKIWTPSFVTLTSGITILVLAIIYYIYDQKFADQVKAPTFLMALGRNSLLIYFGKDLVTSVLQNLKVDTQSIQMWLRDFIPEAVPHGHLIYALGILGLWTILALYLHRKEWYFKV